MLSPCLTFLKQHVNKVTFSIMIVSWRYKNTVTPTAVSPCVRWLAGRNAVSRYKELNGSVPSHSSPDETTGEAEVSWGLQHTCQGCLILIFRQVTHAMWSRL